jgi:hypothetical protein
MFYTSDEQTGARQTYICHPLQFWNTFNSTVGSPPPTPTPTPATFHLNGQLSFSNLVQFPHRVTRGKQCLSWTTNLCILHSQISYLGDFTAGGVRKSKRITSIFKDESTRSCMSLEACCCSSNLRFNLYCLSYSTFFCFLTASMSVSAILVTRCAFTTIL